MAVPNKVPPRQNPDMHINDFGNSGVTKTPTSTKTTNTPGPNTNKNTQQYVWDGVNESTKTYDPRNKLYETKVVDNTLPRQKEVEEAIDYFEERLEENKKELENLNVLNDKFNATCVSNKYSQLQRNNLGDYYNPKEYENMLRNPNYAPAQRRIDKILEDNPEVIDSYKKTYNDCFKNETGITYDEWEASVEIANKNIVDCEMYVSALNDYLVDLPYLEITNSIDYKKWKESGEKNVELSVDMDYFEFGELVLYQNGEKISVFDVDPMKLLEAIKNGSIPLYGSGMKTIAFTSNSDTNYGVAEAAKLLLDLFGVDDILQQFGVNLDLDSSNHYEQVLNEFINYYSYDSLTEDEKSMYSYLFETQGKEAASKYFRTLNVEMRVGKDWADEVLSVAENEDGTFNDLVIAAVGFYDGAKSVGRSIGNLFAKEGTVAAEDYKQMYLLESLKNEGGKFDASIYEISSSIGSQFPSKIAGGVPGILVQSLSAAGNAKNTALLAGADEVTTMQYVCANFITEFGSEYLIGKVPGVDSSVKLSMKNLVSEGSSEALSTVGSAFFDSQLLGKEFDGISVAKDAYKSFTIGAINTLVYGGGDTVKNTILNIDNANIQSYNDLADFMSLINFDGGGIDNSSGESVFVLSSKSATGNSSNVINTVNRLFPGMSIVDSKGNVISGNVSNTNISSNKSNSSVINNNTSSLNQSNVGGEKNNSNNINNPDTINGIDLSDIDFDSEPTEEMIDFDIDDITPTLEMVGQFDSNDAVSNVVDPNIIGDNTSSQNSSNNPDTINDNDLSDIDFGSEPTEKMIDFDVDDITPILGMSGSDVSNNVSSSVVTPNKILHTNIDDVSPFMQQIQAQPNGYEKYLNTDLPAECVIDDIDIIRNIGNGDISAGLKQIIFDKGDSSIETVTACGTVIQNYLSNSIDLSGKDLSNKTIAQRVRNVFNSADLDGFDVLLSDEYQKIYNGLKDGSIKRPDWGKISRLDYLAAELACQNIFFEDFNFWNGKDDSAMKAFTGSDFGEINSAMRNGIDSNNPSVGQNIELLSEQLFDVPGFSDRTIMYRGLDNMNWVADGALSGKYGQDLVDAINELGGGIFTVGNNSFESSTPVMGEGFTSYKNIVEVTSCPKGKFGLYIGTNSANPGEVEYLMQAGTGNKKAILGAEMIGNQIFVYTMIVD